MLLPNVILYVKICLFCNVSAFVSVLSLNDNSNNNNHLTWHTNIDFSFILVEFCTFFSTQAENLFCHSTFTLALIKDSLTKSTFSASNEIFLCCVIASSLLPCSHSSTIFSSLPCTSIWGVTDCLNALDAADTWRLQQYSLKVLLWSWLLSTRLQTCFHISSTELWLFCMICILQMWTSGFRIYFPPFQVELFINFPS